jgi:UDP-glucuronate 4-epimerase
MSPKKIFITGIAGFIGYHLARKLHSQGCFVIGSDNFNAYYDPELKRERERNLKELGITILQEDICQPHLLEKTLVHENITHLVHLAAQAGVRYSMTHPDSYVHSNLNGFVQILEVCRRYPHIKLTYASSSSVYGSNPKIPFSEMDNTDAPTSFYGATKKANEVIANAYHHQYGLSVTGLRFFTVYGPMGRPDMAYYSFTKAILNGDPIYIYGEGQMQRDFTYIDDITEGCIAAIKLESACEIFNLGNNKPENVLTLVSLIEKYTGKTAIREYLPAPKGDVPVTYADIFKSKQYLGFSPKVTLDQGIERFVNWYTSYLAHNRFQEAPR